MSSSKVAVQSRNRLELGFTLVELLVVMLVLGILATAAFPIAEVTVQREREQELKRALWEIRDAIDAYRQVDAGSVPRPVGSPGYPPDLETLVLGTAGVRSGGATYFLRRIPRDPFADPSLPPEKTWGLRSYESPPNSPQPGADVYDVYSRSTKIGLNGVPLREW